MIMKKILFIICAFALLFSGCSSKEIKKAEIIASATEFLSADEAAQYIGYEPIVIENNTKTAKSAKFKNAVAGQGDIAEISVCVPNERKTAEEVKKDFTDTRQRCEEFGTIVQTDGIDAEVFISIPSIHLYKNGCYVVITAGSGGGEEQINLLKNLAAVAVGHISEKIPENIDK